MDKTLTRHFTKADTQVAKINNITINMELKLKTAMEWYSTNTRRIKIFTQLTKSSIDKVVEQLKLSYDVGNNEERWYSHLEIFIGT